MLSSDDLIFFNMLSRSSSLADAARRLNVTPPAVTQRLKSLEERIGVRLIDRTSRGLNLTDEGELLAGEGVAIVDAIEHLGETLGQRTKRVRGKLRIAAPYGFGREYVAPVVSRFMREHGDATVSLELSDHPNVLSSDSWDLVIHIGALDITNRLVTALAPNRRILCATPAYVDNHPRLDNPEDLCNHKCLILRENNEDVTLWRFIHDQHGSTTVRVKPYMAANDGAITRAWALDDHGVMVRSEWDVAQDIAAGRLVQLMPEWRCPDADVMALLGVRHGRSLRVSVFLDMMRQALAPPPWRKQPLAP